MGKKDTHVVIAAHPDARTIVSFHSNIEEAIKMLRGDAIGLSTGDFSYSMGDGDKSDVSYLKKVEYDSHARLPNGKEGELMLLFHNCEGEEVVESYVDDSWSRLEEIETIFDDL